MKKYFTIFSLILYINIVSAHDIKYEKLLVRNWKIEKEKKTILGSFLMLKEGKVFIEDSKKNFLSFPLSSLSKKDQNFVIEKQQKIQQLNKLNRSEKENIESAFSQFSSAYYAMWLILLITLTYWLIIINKKSLNYVVPILFLGILFAVFGFTTKVLKVFKKGTSPSSIDSAFTLFKPNVHTFYDANYFYIESKGIPTTHPMMAGISNHGWQQQVPIPQCYIGSNAWPIPLNPSLSNNPIPVDNVHFTRGAIAIAVNGVPIFNVYTNTGVDSYLDGQLDAYGGHCGRADDYHYHTAPLHLYNINSNNLPIAYALDGYPIFGGMEPDGTSMKTLDENHGHLYNGLYHYHGTPNAPYMIARMAGNVTEDATHQLVPQAAARPVRPSLTPLNGAQITSCTPNTNNNGYKLVYTRNSQTDSIIYSWNTTGVYTFKYFTQGNLDSTKIYNGFTQCTVPMSTGFSKLTLINQELMVFPNPCTDFIFIQLPVNLNEKDCYGYDLINIRGEVLKKSEEFKSTIDLSNLNKGIYFIKVKFPSKILTKKIIIQ